MNISQSEYMERLINMLPDSTFVGRTKLIFDRDSLVSSARLVEYISEEMHNRLSTLQDTDYVNELKDATRNLVVLGRFLSISCDTITGGCNE